MRALLRHCTSAMLAALLVMVPLSITAHAVTPPPTVESNSEETSFAFTSQSRGVLILLDTSGSMSEEDSSGTVKIEAAKSALAEQVQQMPATSNIGLMTFPSGSGIKGSGCDGASVRLPVNNESLAKMNSDLQFLGSPSGGTPTSDALRQAADYLELTDLKMVTIVLVSDGESNCGPPPCETAKVLQAQGVKVVVNTVGFDISAEGAAELQCVAGAAAGRYVDAKDSEQLRQVLREQLDNGVTIDLSAPVTPIPTQSSGFTIKATTSVAWGGYAPNVRLRLEAVSADSGSVIQQPSRMVGNLSPELAGIASWHVSTPSRANVHEVSYRVTASVSGMESQTKEVTVHFTDSALGGISLSTNLQPFKQVLVLGDSYSSGEGAGDKAFPYFQGKDQAEKCHRSHNQYANWLFQPDQVTILACSGAVSSNVDSYGQHGESSQLAQLSHAFRDGYRPELIFLTISGNDIGFGDIATACAMGGWFQFDVLRKNYCPASRESGELYTELTGLIATVDRTVSTTLTDIAAEFQRHGLPTPPIIVSKYPEMISVDSNSRMTCNGFTPSQSVLLGYAFKDFNKIQRSLNTQIDHGVQAAADLGIPAFSVKGSELAIPSSHNLCSRDSWFVPLTVAGKVQNGAEIMHPNVSGHRAMATAINNWAETLTEPPVPLHTAVDETTLVERLFQQWAWSKLEFSDGDLSIKHATRYKIPYGETEIRITGKAPDSGVTVYLKSTPKALGHIVLDEKGEGTLTVNLQASNIPPGEHTVNIFATNLDGTTVHESMAVTIPQPFPTVFWVALGLAALFLAGAVILLIKARKPVRRT